RHYRGSGVTSTRGVKYGYYNGTSWSFQLLEEASCSSGCRNYNDPHIVVDRTGGAHVTYEFRESATTTIYRLRHATDTSGSWQFSTAREWIGSSSSSGINEFHPEALFIDNNDRLYYYYGYDDNANLSPNLYYNTYENGVWSPPVKYFDSINDGKSYSLAGMVFDDSNRFHQGFYEQAGWYDPIYTRHRTDETGAVVTNTVPTSTTRADYPYEIQRDGAGNLYMLIASWATDWSSFHYYMAGNNGSGWVTCNEITALGNLGEIDEMTYTVDANGNFVVVYSESDTSVGGRAGYVVGSTSDFMPSGCFTPAGGNTPPAFTATGPFAVAENTTAGMVGDIDANDGDGGAADVGVTYSITAGNTGSVFSIDPATGVLSQNGSLDYETAASYSLTVQAHDGQASNHTTTSTVVVTVSDVNEPPHSFGLYNTAFYISDAWGDAGRVKVSDLHYSDDALGTNELGVAGLDAAYFEIYQGALYLRAGVDLDARSKDSMSFSVTLDDRSVGASPDQSVSVFLPVYDGTAPRVRAITRHVPTSPTVGVSAVTFAVTFDEVVMGVDAGDFILAGSSASGGGATATVSQVEAEAGGGATLDDVWYVTVSSVNLEGVLSLETLTTGGVSDEWGNPISDATASETSESYSFVFNQPPAIPVLLSPVDSDGELRTSGRTLNPRPALLWEVPGDADLNRLHFQVGLDAVDGSTVLADSASAVTGFSYFDGSSWVAFPSDGVPPDGSGATRVRFVPPGDLTGGGMRHYWTVRASDGAATGGAATVRDFVVGGREFTDAALAARTTRIRVVHLTELRAEIDYARALRGLAPMPWTDPTIVANETRIRAIHFEEMRSAIEQIASAGGARAPAWAATLVPSQTLVLTSHLEELRHALSLY
ncbi:MAG: cadherin repeat domain-containing protein, partial [Verrucomicrobiota bacterium]